MSAGEVDPLVPMARVIGIGNWYRRDDAVGLHAARQLKALDLPGVSVEEATGEGTALMEQWKGAEPVILVDAVHSGAAPGTIHQLDAHQQPVPTGFFRYSTHAFGVAETIELARALDPLPPRLLLFGIEGADFEAGEGLSPAVEAAVPEVIRLIRDRVSSWFLLPG